MWNSLNESNKIKYKKLITNFASLSEAFTQKNDIKSETVTPIVNSKFQETVFQRAFNATGEDIANTSFDASLIINNTHKYLIGIKSFSLKSGDQKIAQFKRNSQKDNWREYFSEIINNVRVNTYEEANKLNQDLYLKLAYKIARLRNDRIASSKAQIRGFSGTDDKVTSIYHVLMPSMTNNKPVIYVGETDYSPIDINNITIIGPTNKKNITNFKFTDGNHDYKYTSADSQLLMNFKNKNIIVDKWEINYVKDPIKVFENLNDHLEYDKNRDYEMIVSWIIYDKNGKVFENSGFNGFNGGSKLSKNKNYREKRIENINKKFENHISRESLDFITKLLSEILLKNHNNDTSKYKMKNTRIQLMDFIESIGNTELIYEIEKMIFRPINEMYIPIPNSKSFHKSYPNFFGENIGLFEKNSSKLLLPKSERTFKLEFIASGNSINAYINQESGKAIQSTGSQTILGKWLLRKVFQLKPGHILTGQRLDELGINAIRLIKFKNRNRGIGLEFFWMDQEKPPEDCIGWASQNREKL